MIKGMKDGSGLPPKPTASTPTTCAHCRFWNTYERMGAVGYCDRVGKDDARFEISDGGGLVTRLDFGCFEWQPLEAD